MQLIAPEILTEARSLSLGLLTAAFSVGLMLWALGWWGHRFWIVLIATVGAGIYGLNSGPLYGVQPLVAGLLLAISAGVLALTLIRLVAYAAGGLAAWMIVHALAPLWDQPLLCFLAGGLIGLLLFRFWTMALTSFVGTLLLTYSGLCLADRLGKMDAVSWADQQGNLFNWLCGVVALLGFVTQILLERRRVRRAREREEDAADDHRSHRYPSRSRWSFSQRRAS
jgi:MFS family permease